MIYLLSEIRYKNGADIFMCRLSLKIYFAVKI